MNTVTTLQGDWIERLRELPENSVHCCVTSPPYFGLRNYGVEGQAGLEKTPEDYIAGMVAGFREVRRVLREDGSLWLNLGDSYARDPGKGKHKPGDAGKQNYVIERGDGVVANRCLPAGWKEKNLLGIPHRVAFALQADGWYLRAICPWIKRNGMPESVRDRPAQTIEYLFMLTKSPKTYYDAEAVKMPLSESFAKDKRHQTGSTDRNEKDGYAESGAQNPKKLHRMFDKPKSSGRIRRTRDWFMESWQGLMLDHEDEPMAFVVNTVSYKGAHFATFPPKLIEPCILSSTSEKGCCSACGAPWKRVIAKTDVPDPSYKGSSFDAGKTGDRDGGERTQAGERYLKTTVGWELSCTCESSALGLGLENPSVVPCTVLDPFGGSGTTGQVAKKHGRSAILIELNPAYIPLIAQRVA